MKKNQIAWSLGALAVLLIVWWWFGGEEEDQRDLTAQAFVGRFEDIVTSTGELVARNSEEIKGPSQMRRYRLYNVKIAELVPEGTYVEKGDFVANLDKSDLSARMSDVATELEKAKSQFTQVRLDTSLTLREKRSAIESLEFDIRQKKVELEQSTYEPPATIQRLKLDLEKLNQSLTQTRENYQITKAQSQAKMREAAATLAQQQSRFDELKELEKEFRITAPKAGMVIYKRFRNGQKRSTGDNISPWDPSVATLPDLSFMESITYINEVDIRKVKTGQEVMIGLDAFPEAKLTGKVTSVANVGEERENSDSKVFLVEIKVNETDSTYRPGMTTSNNIITEVKDSVLQIPIESVFTANDTSFVYLKSGVSIRKQEVKLGANNEEFVIILAGLQANDVVYLNEPAGMKEEEIQTLVKEEA